MAQGKKTRHHYVPQFYLAGFTDPADERLLWIYDKSGDGEPKQTSVPNAGLQKHFYIFQNQHGQRDSETLENALATVEGQVAPILRKLKARAALAPGEREQMSYFLGLMHVRGPAFRAMICQLENAHFKAYEQLLAANPEAREYVVRSAEREMGEVWSEEDRRGFAEALQDEIFEIEVPVEESLHLLPLAHPVGDRVCSMSWTVLSAPTGKFFVSSDNPMIYLDPDADEEKLPAGLDEKSIEVTFPLARDLLLQARWGTAPLEYMRATAEQVASLNERTTRWADRFVYAPFRSNRVKRLVRNLGSIRPRLDTRFVVSRDCDDVLVVTPWVAASDPARPAS